MHTLSIGLFFKNDHHYLREWVEYYRIIGVEHFYMACNDDDPSASHRLLEPYIARGIMTFRTISGGPGVVKQMEAHEWFLSRADTIWLVVADLDEFMMPVKDKYLIDVLTDYQHYGGVAANWINYGSSGLYFPPPLATKGFVYRAAEDFPDHQIFKCVIQPKKVAGPINPHTFKMKTGEHIVDELGRKIVEGTVYNYSLPATYRRLRVNHYRVRSWTDFKAKCQRWAGGGHPDLRDDLFGYFARSDQNEVLDLSMYRYVPEIKSQLGKIA